MKTFQAITSTLLYGLAILLYAAAFAGALALLNPLPLFLGVPAAILSRVGAALDPGC